MEIKNVNQILLFMYLCKLNVFNNLEKNTNYKVFSC